MWQQGRADDIILAALFLDVCIDHLCEYSYAAFSPIGSVRFVSVQHAFCGIYMTESGTGPQISDLSDGGPDKLIRPEKVELKTLRSVDWSKESSISVWQRQ